VRVGRVETVGPGGEIKVEYDSAEAPQFEQKANKISWPEPLKAEAFYGPIGELVRLIEPHTESDPAAILFQSLSSFGNVVGRDAFFAVEAGRHHANLFCVVVGETAKARKGTSWGHVRRTFEAVDPHWAQLRIVSGLSSGEGLIWSVRDAIEKQEPVRDRGRVIDYQKVVEDPGVTDKRTMVHEAEFASLLRMMDRDGNTLSLVVRDAWDMGNLGTLTKNSPARSTGAHISICGHITRPELLRYLTRTEAASGFANRFLWVCARRSKILPEGGQIDSVDFAPLVSQLKSAVEFARTVGEVRRDDAARKIWCAVYEQLSEGKPGLFGSIVSRAEAQVVRLALVYALADRSRVIAPEHLCAGLAAWDYCEESARYVFGDALGYPEADTILSALVETPDGLTRSEIAGLFGRHKSVREIDGALAALEALGRATRHPEKTGGRPVERWKAVTR
jgi:hypothetical protein